MRNARARKIKFIIIILRHEIATRKKINSYSRKRNLSLRQLFRVINRIKINFAGEYKNKRLELIDYQTLV